MSHLIIASDKTRRENYALQTCKEQHIDPFDITIVESEQALGMNDIRGMQKTIFLKPLKSEKKAIILKNAHTATIESQNALLKALEEPPVNTIIILTATTANALLPTILSRCKITFLDKPSGELPEEDQKKYTGILVYLQQASISEKLKTAQDLAKDKEKAIEWLGNTIKAARIQMLEHLSEKGNISKHMLQLLQKAYTALHNTNVNARFLLEHTFLNF